MTSSPGWSQCNLMLTFVTSIILRNVTIVVIAYNHHKTNGKVIIMSDNYYRGLVTGLIAQYPAFKQIVSSTCPTRWIDGTVCPPAHDAYNKAFMEAEFIVELLDSAMCICEPECSCDKYNCNNYMVFRTCYGVPPL